MLKIKWITSPLSTAKPQHTLKNLKKQPTPCCSPGPPLMNERERGLLQSVEVFATGYCPEDSEEDEQESPLDPGLSTLTKSQTFILRPTGPLGLLKTTAAKGGGIGHCWKNCGSCNMLRNTKANNGPMGVTVLFSD